MLDQKTEKRIQQDYQRMKHGRIKWFLLYLVVCAIMIGMISLFLGNPFPHRKTVLSFSLWNYRWNNKAVWDDGWIYTCLIARPYWLVLFCAAGLILSFVGILSALIKDLTRFKQIILKQCDVQRYLEIMEYGVAYGQKLKCRDFQESVFLVMQQELALALIADARLEECRRFLTEEWIGKKNSGFYKRTVMNLELAEAFAHSDADGFCELIQKAGNRFKKQKLLIAEKMFLEQKYEQTVEFLTTYKAENPYCEVARQYLTGVCCDKIGNRKMAEACMQYAAAHGNTMPCRQKAQEWLSRNEL